MKRIAVYIDGQNLYHALKAMGISHTSHYDYGKLIRELTGIEPVYIGYYVGQLPRNGGNDVSRKLYGGQQRFLSLLKKNIPHLNLVLGKIMRIKVEDEIVFYEKGVDVRLSVDMVHHAIQDQFDEAYLISSDSDFVPAVHLIQEYQKKVCCIGFQKQKSIALIEQCDHARILTGGFCSKFSVS